MTLHESFTNHIKNLCKALEENPELVNKDPYGEGWLIKVKPADVKAVEDLLDAEAYKAVVNG